VNGPTLLSLALALLGLGLVFGLLERRFAARRGQPWFRRRDRGVDAAYWVLAPLLTRFVTRFAVGVAVVALALLGGASLAGLRADLEAGGFPDLSLFGLGGTVRALPFAAQLALGLLVADFVGYWVHRLFHRRPLWGFHAVHHSSPNLDWLSSVRVHPLNDAIGRVLQAVPLLWLGFEPAVFLAVAPITTLYALLLHANLRWTYGPLRFVLASPAFHRWHHAADREARDRNFAGFFPVFDILFGTFYMPPGREPAALGVGRERVPAGFLAQMAYPFRRAPAGAPIAADLAS
jgi:sterol desaturase/sphingolipid hydroxylase (fatty acid hydroxylase superfamily)